MNYARIYRKAKIGIAIEEWKNMYVMSLRLEPGIDLNKVLRILGKELGVRGTPACNMCARVKKSCSRSSCRSWSG